MGEFTKEELLMLTSFEKDLLNERQTFTEAEQAEMENEYHTMASLRERIKQRMEDGRPLVQGGGRAPEGGHAGGRGEGEEGGRTMNLNPTYGAIVELCIAMLLIIIAGVLSNAWMTNWQSLALFDLSMLLSLFHIVGVWFLNCGPQGDCIGD
jgi:hypothetical protein